MEYDDLEIIEDEIEVIKQSKLDWLMKNYKNIPMTYILVAINVLVFLIIHVTNFLIADNWFLLKFAKDTHHMAMENEFYRFFTPIFMHEAIMHLAFNCMAIIYLGKPVEQIFGKYKLLLIFLASGLFGTLSSFIFTDSLSIGASGGVFGFFGVHLYLYLKNKGTYLKVFGKDILQLLIINVIIGFAVPGIDYWAHFGGIFGGFLACNAVGLTHSLKLNKNLIIGFTSIAILFSGLFIYFKSEYVNYSEYVDISVEMAFELLKDNNIDEVKIIRNDIIANRPMLPPIYINHIIEYFDNIINSSE